MYLICSKTGSDGNFSVISDSVSCIVVDCGVKWEKANKMSGYTLIDADAMLVSHAHGDHAAFISQFIQHGLNVYATEETWAKEPISPAYNGLMHTIDGSQIIAGSFIVKPFKVPHTNSDGSPCENYGFLIYSTVTKEKMLWVTDCAYIENKFPPCDYICIECNYLDIEDYSKELEYVNSMVEKRRFTSHLSLNRCVSFLHKQDLSRVKFIKMLHLTKTQGIIKDKIKERFEEEFPSIEVVV